jgi:hypothetical protein
MMSLTQLPLLNRKRNPRPLRVSLLLPVEQGVENVENVVDEDELHHEVVAAVAGQEEATLMKMVFVTICLTNCSIQRPRRSFG